MKLKELLKAQEPLKRLTEKRFRNYKTIRVLVNLRKAVDAEVDIYLEQEKKAIKAYAELDANGNPVLLSEGRIRLRDEKAKAEFDRELIALLEAEVENIKHITLREEDFCSDADMPTPNDVITLEPIVIFE